MTVMRHWRNAVATPASCSSSLDGSLRFRCSLETFANLRQTGLSARKLTCHLLKMGEHFWRPGLLPQTVNERFDLCEHGEQLGPAQVS